MKIGFTACRIGLAVLLVPYLFAFKPALLMKGELHTILLVTFTGIIGVFLLACSTIGFLLHPYLLLIELVIPVVLFQLNERKRKKRP